MKALHERAEPETPTPAPSEPTLDNVEDVYPLTPLQEGMVFHAIAEPDTALHVGRIVCELAGTLDIDAFQRAWNQVLARHPALRTAFVWEGLEAPMQVVRKKLEMPFRHHDWRDLSREEAGKKFDTWLWQDAVTSFDLTDAPLARVDLFSLAPDKHQLVWACHHAIADGWSTGVVLEELMTFLSGAGQSSLPSAPRYRNHIAWLLKRDVAEDERFWHAYLKGFDKRPSIDARLPVVLEQSAKRRHYTSAAISADDLRPIMAAARSSRVTLNSLFQAAWSLVLSRYAASDDVVFGVVSSGRPDGVQGVERMVGLLVTTTPMRVQIDERDRVRTFLERIQTDATHIRRHEHAALTNIQGWSDLPPGEALFDSLYVFGNYPPQAQHPDATLRLGKVDIKAPSTFPLALLVDPDGNDGLVVTAVTDPTTFSDDIAKRLVDAVVRTAHALVKDIDARIIEIDCLAKTEQETLDHWGQGDGLQIRCDDVVNGIEDVAARMPNAIAVTGQDVELSYGELLTLARSGAFELTSLGIAPGEPVIVHIDRGPMAIIGILSVLLAGGAYLPLDPTYPLTRRLLIAKDSRARFVVTAGKYDGLFDDLTKINLDNLAPKAPADWSSPEVAPKTPAYIIYTSGSTGRPKGVVISRANLAYSNTARKAFYGEAPKAFLLLSSLAFDSSVVGLFWTLSTGGKLVVSEYRLEQDVANLADRIATHGVTHLLCLPSLHAILIEQADPRQLASLTHAIVAGEVCPSTLPANHRNALPDTKLINEYGPTEASVWSIAGDITDTPTNQPPSIGRPIPGTMIKLVDHRNRTVPDGVIGEIMIGGPGVALGYHHQPDMMAKSFVHPSASSEQRYYKTGDYARWRADGTLDYRGRRDGQLKIRGHRIEVTEIEAAIEEASDVKAAAVIAVRTDQKGARLAAFIEGHDVDTDALRLALEDRLPDAMLPSAFTKVEILPRLPNGKVDRYALAGKAETKIADLEIHHYRAATNPTEQSLVEIWERVLKVDRVGIGDDFFALGGDSLASIRIVSLAKREGLAIKPTSVLEYPTIEALARSMASPTEPAATDDDQTSAKPLFMIHGGSRMREKLQEKFRDRYTVHLFDDHWDDGCLSPTTTVDGMANEYLAELKSISPHGPYRLGGYSIGSAVSIVIAKRLMAAGEEVELLFLLDPLDQVAFYGGVKGLDPEVANTLKEVQSDHPLSEKTSNVSDTFFKAYTRYLRGPARLLRGALAYYTGRSLSPKIASDYAWIVYNSAIRRHELSPYPGRLLIFRSVLGRDLDQDYVWAKLATGDYVEKRFHCEHIAFRRDPDIVKAWMQQVADHLDGTA